MYRRDIYQFLFGPYRKIQFVVMEVSGEFYAYKTPNAMAHRHNSCYLLDKKAQSRNDKR